LSKGGSENIWLSARTVRDFTSMSTRPSSEKAIDQYKSPTE
jgi:hypothetical protein